VAQSPGNDVVIGLGVANFASRPSGTLERASLRLPSRHGEWGAGPGAVGWGLEPFALPSWIEGVCAGPKR